MWEAACEYFEWCEDNPFYESKPMVTSNGGNEGSSIEMAEIPIKRPFTLEGLCLYMNASSAYFRVFKSEERAKKEDYLTVINAIEETIANQQFSGAAAGFFNANIIARKLGLKEQTDITTQGEKIAPVITVMVDGQIIDGEMK
jgi:hypothetical protein